MSNASGQRVLEWTPEVFEAINYMNWAWKHRPEIVREIMDRDLFCGSDGKWQDCESMEELQRSLARKDGLLAAANRGMAKWRAAK